MLRGDEGKLVIRVIFPFIEGMLVLVNEIQQASVGVLSPTPRPRRWAMSVDQPTYSSHDVEHVDQ